MPFNSLSFILISSLKYVPLHPVWSKLYLGTQKKVDRNVENLSNYRKEGTDW